MRPGEQCGVCHVPFIEGQEVLEVPRIQGPPSWIHTLCPSQTRRDP
jgi:hypothetical protein